MKTSWFSLMIVVSLCWGVVQGSKNAPSVYPASTLAREKSGDNLICSISTQSPKWRTPPVQVIVVVENRSKSALNILAVPAFVLKPLVPAEESLNAELSYLALWDMGKEVTLPLSSTVSLQLKPGESRKITQDASNLLWSRMNSSLLPHSKLFEVVPAGKYVLQLRLTGKDDRVLCSSNEVSISMK
jgi:hypothetical protein